MRDKVVFESVNSQILSALAASEPCTSAVPDAIVATTLNVFGSIRTSDPSPHAGAQRLPKAETMPPHGLLRPAIGPASFICFDVDLVDVVFRRNKKLGRIENPIGTVRRLKCGLRLQTGKWDLNPWSSDALFRRLRSE